MDAYGPAYSNGLAQETGMDYREGQREAEGGYMEATESYEEAMKDNRKLIMLKHQDRRQR